MPIQKKINGIDSFDNAIMILGLRNTGSSKTNLQITYAAIRNSDEDNTGKFPFISKIKISLLGTPIRRVVVGGIIAASVISSFLSCCGGYSACKEIFFSENH